MKKIRYYFKRLFNMNFSVFFNTVNVCSKLSNKCKIIVFFDIIICSIKYGAGHLDYKNFKMYELNSNDRNKILTVGRNATLIRKLNEKDYQKYFESKVLFNQTFSKYIGREYLLIHNNNYDEFCDFISSRKNYMAKPIDGSCGKGIEKIEVSSKSAKELYNDLIKNNQLLVEEVATQCKEMSSLHPASINTIRIFTIVNDNGVFNNVGSYIRIGNENRVVDNFNSGGIACPLNSETGVITHKAVNKKGELFEYHPVTKVKLIGFRVPKWNEILDLVKEASKKIPQVKYVGWDVCVSEKGPILIEANSFPGQDLYQIPKENIGTYNIMTDALKKTN